MVAHLKFVNEHRRDIERLLWSAIAVFSQLHQKSQVTSCKPKWGTLLIHRGTKRWLGLGCDETSWGYYLALMPDWRSNPDSK
jgi:hypothetical protein